MPRFIFFTKTRWEEPPRLRHQMAGLLATAGHDVVFFEKPAPFWRPALGPQRRAAHITSLQHKELVHHRLRLVPALHRVNARVVAHSVRRELQVLDINDTDVIISFNYDYWFLRRLFPENHIVTVINDDFICVALLGYTKPLLWALQRTCLSSDRVLTVSVPLQKQLAPYSNPELFLPWADRPYRAPIRSRDRDTLLFWGYINRRLDYAAIQAFADALAKSKPEVRLLFVGPVAEPVDASTKSDIAALRSRTNVKFAPPSRLDDLPIDRVLAAYIPYRPFDGEIDAITLSNKGLQLLARGLPLLISSLPGLPNFIEAPFVTRVDLSSVPEQIDRLRTTFETVQPEIQRFVARNGPDSRLRQLLAGLHGGSSPTIDASMSGHE